MWGGRLRIVATAQIETVAAVLGHDRAAARKRLERIEPIILNPEGALAGLTVVDQAGPRPWCPRIEPPNGWACITSPIWAWTGWPGPWRRGWMCR